MNQSYKTIFSKVHQCFVVVSELTKSHGKGSTSVNCGAKAKGRRVALAFAIALSVTGGCGVHHAPGGKRGGYGNNKRLRNYY